MEYMKKRYVITGMGICNSLGVGVNNTFAQLLNTSYKTPNIGKWDSCNDPAIQIHRAFELPIVDNIPHNAYNSREARTWPLLAKAAAIAVQEAVEQSNFKTSNVATLLTTVRGGSEYSRSFTESYHAGKTKVNPFHVLGMSYDFTTNAIAAKYQWNGPNTTMHSACASGLYGLDYAIKCLSAGDCEIAVVGGTDTMADPYGIYFFQALHALSKRNEPFISQPFSNERDGFVMGEGAGVVVVETLEYALKRGANIIAEVCGMGFYTEADHPTSPSVNGVGAKASATMAVNRAGLELDEIDFINAHATSTPQGDIVEYNAMNDLFPKSVITSAKGHIGHTMGASAIIELIYGIKSMQTNTILPVANFTNCDFERELQIATKPLNKLLKYFIKNSFGFGGKCASVVIGKY